MKKLLLTMLFVSALAVVDFAQIANTKSNTAQPTTKSRTVITSNNSASTGQANKANNTATPAQNTSMTKPQLNHPAIHTSKQKITK